MHIGIFRITGSADFPANVQGATGLSLALSNGTQITPLWGRVDGNQFEIVIPEPSAVLLGALGMLGLVRRRR
ncbi:MAG: PEP-CTERM sorting domain-containing protein [Verrucomicrobiaceae bacterium]|nr:MAG: PEP-CTERM sorting domain-containing protein [Verrucomicrobiaceae bacterium]